MSKSIDIQLVTKENVWNRTEEEKNSSLKSKHNLIKRIESDFFFCKKKKKRFEIRFTFVIF